MSKGLIAKISSAQLFLVSCLSAFCFGSASAAPCVLPPASSQAIVQFKASPQALVAPESDARTLEATVRDLAGTDANLAADIVRLAESASQRFRTAIAAGLAQAAVACANLDQHAALIIQQAVAGFDDGDFQASFAAVAGDLSTAATEAAAASASSSVGSVVVVNPNTSEKLAINRGGGGGGTPLSAITSITVTAATTTPSPSTTAASPVSATH